jgi:3-oxoacyl-[acyl-carrier protein] reductase
MANLALDFTGRTAIVSGAARGIGLEVARQLRSAGAAVYLLDYDQDEVLRAADEIGARGLAGDVSRTDDVEVAVQQAVEETGRLDIVVNNAGVLRDKVLWRLSDEDWDSVLAVHLGGTFRLTRAAVPHFRRQEYGRSTAG